MTDFDARLRERLLHLDQAIPDVAPPAAGTRTGRVNRGRRVLLLLAAGLALLAASSLGVGALQAQRDAATIARDTADEERVRDDLGPSFENACLSHEQAASLIGRRLTALGLTDWHVRADDRIREARCVGAAPIGDAHEVLLIPSMGGDVAKALDTFAADLMNRCLPGEEAVAKLRAILTGLGVNNPRVETSGIRQVPVENGDAYLEHAKAGCAVYGGAQFDGVGRYTWFISRA